LDPRLEVIDRRLEKIDRIVGVTGGKGGIGKSSVACGLAVTLAQCGKAVGLLDLDFCGPSTHVILGIKDAQFVEDRGLIPPLVRVSGADHGLRFMSIIHFVGDSASPLRGTDVSNAMIELFAITQWGKLDYLILDMPPGLGDAVLDTVRLMKRAEFLAVTTPSVVALETVKKILRLLIDLKRPVIGVVENMRRGDEPSAQAALAPLGVPFLGALPFDEAFERSLGDIATLSETQFLQALRGITNEALLRL